MSRGKSFASFVKTTCEMHSTFISQTMEWISSNFENTPLPWNKSPQTGKFPEIIIRDLVNRTEKGFLFWENTASGS